MKKKHLSILILVILFAAIGVMGGVQHHNQEFMEENLLALSRGDGVDLEYCYFEISNPSEYDFMTPDNACKDGTDEFHKKECDFKWAYFNSNGGKCF